ncbi:MAG: selenobiotic family peptide radical SAM maturase [Proteobacteria bacterium]|nr:selenobiotic family peptide radical SAM maturase [Pseudomonadota bacterium]MBU4294601.1 selenobiotic family peptide radical SAM maturase [Pseudomonadota bacterium]MCG2747136.1 thio(seleno)oxazole modification radical SAM maturase SbtM [Desulfobulbaceae bacterium]
MRPELIFPVCFSFLDDRQQQQLLAENGEIFTPENLPSTITKLQESLQLPPYFPELARLELAFFQMQSMGFTAISAQIDQITVNPTLQLLKLNWKNLCSLLPESKHRGHSSPQPEEEFVLIYCQPVTGKVVIREARDEDLLALKIVVEQIRPEAAAAEGKVAVGVIDRVLDRAAGQGILLKPPSAIRRNPQTFPRGEDIAESYFFSPVFTLQWHITQVCDLHCKHCYDRSDRVALPLAKGLAILDDLRSFCREYHVQGQVSFSGGNPLLYPYFLELYQAAVDRNLMVAILGNPAPRATMEKIIAIQKPEFFQVSLEGLLEHNDYIRGKGHFARVMDFLDLLRELGIYSMVMLTLTRDNMDQVLPLAELLRDRVDLFTFNRLAMVGEGASLQSVQPQDYAGFLGKYLAAARENPCISLKDNLMNIIRRQENQPLFGGCAGHGCGAAFNFFSILPDGEAHACRKLPSHIGNVFEQSISAIYHGEPAQRYRAGSAACVVCPIRPVCGGCLAVVHGFGLDVFKDKDPYCFFPETPAGQGC